MNVIFMINTFQEVYKLPYNIEIIYLYFMNVIFKINTFREVYKLTYNIEIIILFLSFMIYICILRIVILLFKESKFE